MKVSKRMLILGALMQVLGGCLIGCSQADKTKHDLGMPGLWLVLIPLAVFIYWQSLSIQKESFEDRFSRMMAIGLGTFASMATGCLIGWAISG